MVSTAVWVQPGLGCDVGQVGSGSFGCQASPVVKVVWTRKGAQKNLDKKWTKNGEKVRILKVPKMSIFFKGHPWSPEKLPDTPSVVCNFACQKNG